MPLLGPLKCTVCGSADLRQVKPETYFCNHCDSVSKLADPSRVTVEPAFCAHGDPIAARCQVCGAGLCAGGCEMAGLRGPDREEKIMTVGFGYLQADSRPGGTLAPDVVGPFLTRGKLLDSLKAARGERLRHLCETCLLDAVPGAADRLAAHLLCEDPWCWYDDHPLGACACCGGTFCDKSVVRDRREAFDADVSFAYSLQDSAVIESQIGVKAAVPIGAGRYCLPCMYEREQRVRDQGRQIARRDYGSVLPLKPGASDPSGRWLVFQVPVGKKVGWRRQEAENNRARDLAERYAAELSASIARSLAGCRRREQFDRPQPRERRWPDRHGRYVIVDERATTPAAAAGRAL